jgi:hypothetical protein
MSDEHKAALAIGRSEGRIVRDYLDALRSNKPKRGRKRTAESITNRLQAIEAELPEAGPLDEVKLVQERRDLKAELAAMGNKIDIGAREKAFVKIARSYSQRQGIGYASWREVGVEPSVLKAAGIARTD